MPAELPEVPGTTRCRPSCRRTKVEEVLSYFSRKSSLPIFHIAYFLFRGFFVGLFLADLPIVDIFVSVESGIVYIRAKAKHLAARYV